MLLELMLLVMGVPCSGLPALAVHPEWHREGVLRGVGAWGAPGRAGKWAAGPWLCVFYDRIGEVERMGELVVPDERE